MANYELHVLYSRSSRVLLFDLIEWIFEQVVLHANKSLVFFKLNLTLNVVLCQTEAGFQKNIALYVEELN